MIKNINCILFLLNLIFIFFSEILLYALFQNYSLFIERLAIRLVNINILYVKLFQAFAFNKGLIDDKINNKLIKFTDNVPWNYTDIDFYQLNQMCYKYNITLQYKIPINSGMISLVFKGYAKPSNNPIIIKIKRKNIQEKLNNAINNLLFFLYVLSFIPFINKYQITDVITKNIEIIRHQTNFFEEISNMNKIRNNCKNIKYIKIPIANEFITQEYPDIIVMDFIEGIQINKIKDEDYNSFAKLMIKFGIITTIIHGLVHGDLHCGNILLIKDNNDIKYPHKLGVIDFGIIYEVKTNLKDILFDILINLFVRSHRDSVIKLLNSGIIDPPGILEKISKKHYNNIIDITEKLLSETINDKQANQIQIYKFLFQIKEYLCLKELTNIGIRPSDEFVKLQLILAMTHGITTRLCKDNFILLIDQVINELFCLNVLLNN